jgi:hypothetical protein
MEGDRSAPASTNASARKVIAMAPITDANPVKLATMTRTTRFVLRYPDMR